MITTRTLVIGVLGLVLSARVLQGQDRPQYRGFQLGGDFPSMSAWAQVVASDVKTIDQRSTATGELEWSPPYVQQITFSFSSDPLSKMVADADRDRTAGVTDADIIDAISTAYGPSSKPAVKKTRTVPSQMEEKIILPWGLRRVGAGVGLTVSGVNISIQRNGVTLSKSVTF